MTIEEAIEALDILRIFDAQKLSKAVKMAIAALRAQQAPAKLDRSLWKGCDSCENQKIREIMLKHKRKYCSLCGKPLTEEAWEETARRIGGNDGTTN